MYGWSVAWGETAVLRQACAGVERASRGPCFLRLGPAVAYRCRRCGKAILLIGATPNGLPAVPGFPDLDGRLPGAFFCIFVAVPSKYLLALPILGDAGFTRREQRTVNSLRRLSGADRAEPDQVLGAVC